MKTREDAWNLVSEYTHGAGLLRHMLAVEAAMRTYARVPRDSLLRKTLAAVDELTGLIHAVALVRPSKAIRDVAVKSVRKKWKDRAFAAGANRQEIEAAVADLEIDLWEHVGIVLEAMKGISEELGLAGTR